MTAQMGVLEWLNEKERGVGRKTQLEVAEWMCDPAPVRQTEQIEFTDLTNLNHRIRTELSDSLWPLRREADLAKKSTTDKDEKEDEQPGLIFLGFMRRGIPLQHTKVTLRRGGNEYPLTRLKMSQTEELALSLLDNVWTQCSKDELKAPMDRNSSPPGEFAVPRPFEFALEDERELETNPPTRLDGHQRYVSRFWREFLGIGSRNVNADWALLDSRFDLRESWRANELWRHPTPQEPKWSVERALLAKLSARLAFSYILSAWVPVEACKAQGPVEIELDFQERVLDPHEQSRRIAALRQRSKKSFERTLAANLQGRSDPRELANDGLRLNYAPETYLGLLEPSLDDPDDGRRINSSNEPENEGDANDYVELVRDRSSLHRTASDLVSSVGRLVVSIWKYLCDRKAFLVFAAIPTTVLLLWLYLNAARGLVFDGPESSELGAFPDFSGSELIFARDFVVGMACLVGAALISGLLIASRLAISRRSTVILPSWNGGSCSPIYEITTPKEFSVWQGILARPSNRGRGWKIRPAAELGMKASFWWQDPSDRGHVPAPVPGRPHLLIMELRARMSRDLVVYGFALCFLAAGLLLVPALLHLFDPGRWSLLENAGADTVATVLLLLPTAGGALLVRPGEDPIASQLLQKDRLMVAFGAVLVSAIAVLMVLILGWPDSSTPRDLEEGSSKTRQEKVETKARPTTENGAQTSKVTETFESSEQSGVFWSVWLLLGSFSLVTGVALLRSLRDARELGKSQPASRQGGRDSSRRKPLDVPAPVPSIQYWWGRRFARRSLLRLSPRRGVRKVTPRYSLVLPAEGSRIFTPPSPTVLCLYPEGEANLSHEDVVGQVSMVLEQARANEDPIYSTNDVAWVASRSLEVMKPDRSFVGPNDEPRRGLERDVLHLLRMRTANARPSHSKPFGNGGGVCVYGVEQELFDSLMRTAPDRSYTGLEKPLIIEAVAEHAALEPRAWVELEGVGGRGAERKKVIWLNANHLGASVLRREVEVKRKGESFELLVYEAAEESKQSSAPMPVEAVFLGDGDPVSAIERINGKSAYLTAELHDDYKVGDWLRESPRVELALGKATNPLILGSSPNLQPEHSYPSVQKESAAWRSLVTLQGALNRASLDFDAMILLEPARDSIAQRLEVRQFQALESLSRVLSNEASLRARKAGSGAGAHSWPSSLESPLAGESELWPGSRRTGTWTSLRWPLLRRSKGHWQYPGWFQTNVWGLVRKHIFDHHIRRIPVASVQLGPRSERQKGAESFLGLGDRALFDWLEAIPRVYSRIFARGGYPTEADPVSKKDLGARLGEAPSRPSQPEEEPSKPKVVYIAGNVGSGKSSLALKVRQKLAGHYRKQWEVLRPDSNNNLFFQLLNLEEPKSIDAEDLNYSRFQQHGEESPTEDFVEYLMEVTFLLEASARLWEELKSGKSDGIIVEYWPEFSVQAMGKAQLLPKAAARGSQAKVSKPSGNYYFEELEALLDDCRAGGPESPEVLLLVAEDEKTLIQNNARRREQRKNEKVSEAYLRDVGRYLDEMLQERPYGIASNAIPSPIKGRRGGDGLSNWRKDLGTYKGNKKGKNGLGTYWDEIWRRSSPVSPMGWTPKSVVYRYKNTSGVDILVVRDGDESGSQVGPGGRTRFSGGLSMLVAREIR